MVHFLKKKNAKAALAVIALIALSILFFRNGAACGGSIEPVIVAGDSLAGVLENGTEVELHHGYYSCNPVERGDIVVASVGNNRVIKMVRAVPGDRWQLVQQADGSATIIVNGQELATMAGVPYRLTGKRIELLNLYVRDYKGVIPQNAYLLLGNQEEGSRDSSTFGLVSIGAIAGKVFE